MLVLLRQNLAHAIHERRSVAVVERPDRVSVVRVIVAPQPVVDVASPLVVLALAACLVPVVPVLSSQVLAVDLLVTIAILGVSVGVSVIDTIQGIAQV